MSNLNEMNNIERLHDRVLALVVKAQKELGVVSNIELDQMEDLIADFVEGLEDVSHNIG